jgi:hypothetical protein
VRRFAGREAKGLEVFNEALAYYGRLEQEGVIEGFETVILEPHGGDLEGFILVRGSEEKLASLGVDDEFVRLSTRASLIVESVGVRRSATGSNKRSPPTRRLSPSWPSNASDLAKMSPPPVR